MIRDRASLLDALARVEELPRTAERRLALAEAEFRLAVDPAAGPEEAVERLERAIAHDPFAAKLHLHLGRALHRDGRHRAAAAAYRRAGRLAPESRRIRLLLALAMFELGKAERDAGQYVLDALAADDKAASAAAVATVDALLAREPAVDHAKPPPARLARASAEDTWQPALIAHLAKESVAGTRISAQLDKGRELLKADGVAAYAIACVLMLVTGETPRAVRALVTEAGMDRQPENPAVAMLVAAVELADIEDAARLGEEIARRVQSGAIPPELACWLHYKRHIAAPPPALFAMRLLDAYPPVIAKLDCFVELRIAILDHCARRAWTDKRYDAARLLWHEATALDPHRVEVNANLALLAARTRATDEYGPAWERFAEGLYLHSAAAGDVQHHLDDRLTLHRTLAWQSAAGSRAGRPRLPNESELAAWLATPDAVEVWLREWDLYYLNARLSFRSPWHLLGVPADADAAALREAREAFVHHLDAALAGLPWRGVTAFLRLATAVADGALRAALSSAGPGADANHERESLPAEALTDELVRRVQLLHWLNRDLARQRSAAALTLGSAVALRQFALPSGPLQRLCVERGLLEAGEVLVDTFANDLVEITARWDQPPPDGERQSAERLAALDRCVAAAPHLIAVRAHRCRLLRRMGRNAEAYAAAEEAISLRPGGPSTEDGERHRADLVALMESIRADRGARRRATRERPVVRRFPRGATFMVELDADSHYAVLGLEPDATPAAIRAAANALSTELTRRWQREPTNRDELDRRRKEVNALSRVLTAPAERKKYDRENPHLRLFTPRSAAAGMFVSRADLLEVLHRAMREHLRAAGVPVLPLSDLDRLDFSDDLTPHPLLDGTRIPAATPADAS